MPNSQSSTFIACTSPADGIRLANLLTNPTYWAGGTPPDKVESNNGQVECYWTTNAAIQVTAPVAAIVAAKVAVPTAATTITHRNSNGSSTSKF